MRQSKEHRQVPQDLDELAGIVVHVLGFGVPGSLAEVRVDKHGPDLTIYFGFDGQEGADLEEQARTIGSEVLSHASAGVRIDEQITFAADAALRQIGQLVFARQ